MAAMRRMLPHDFKRVGPALFDCVSKAVEGANAPGIAAP